VDLRCIWRMYDSPEFEWLMDNLEDSFQINAYLVWCRNHLDLLQCPYYKIFNINSIVKGGRTFSLYRYLSFSYLSRFQTNGTGTHITLPSDYLLEPDPDSELHALHVKPDPD
jgi:hypothetical protein